MRPVTTLRLFDARDEPWIAQLLEVVDRCLGQPWRVLLDRIEHTPLRNPAPRIAAIVGALRRVLGGRTARTRIARQVRGKVLGHPALDPDSREARIAIAAVALGIEPRDVEELLWADLARERPVVLPEGRPSIERLIAYANLDRIQRAMRRAREVHLRVSGDSRELVRAVARYGLLASIVRSGEATIFHLKGPLSLFHATTVYGRALAALVPLLADQQDFVLDIICEVGGGERTLRVEPPVSLPPVPLPRRGPSLAERLARDLAGLGCQVGREPPAIESEDHLLFPELVFEHLGRRWLVEILGFSTDEYLTDKLVRYEAAGRRDVLLCIDAARSGEQAVRDRVVPYRRRIDAEALLRAAAAGGADRET